MDYQAQRIQDNQKFLLKLLHLHIGNYYPLRKWLGISYKGKIDEITHLSIAYNTKYFKKGKKWFKQVTRTYQQPDLGYKLCQILDKIPQLAFIPALLQPAYGLGALAFFFLTQTTFQPSSKDTFLYKGQPSNNYGSQEKFDIYDHSSYMERGLIHFDISDIEDDVTFSQGDLILVSFDTDASFYVSACRLIQTAWTEGGATWNKYDGTNAWASAGGDFTTTNSVSLLHDGNNTYTWHASSLIQDCYDNQSKNVHLLLKVTDETNSGKYTAYRSREYTADTTERPKLTVTYTVPANFFPFF